MVLVSHDFRLISQVANEIWICEKQKVTKWETGILAYKEILKRNVLDDDGNKKNMAAASADHYHKDDVAMPKLPKKKAPEMKITGLSAPIKKTASPKSSSPARTNGAAGDVLGNGIVIAPKKGKGKYV